MKNTDIDFSKLKENTKKNIEKGIKRERLSGAVRSYVVYPSVLLCLLLGLVFTLEDGASHVFGVSDGEVTSSQTAEVPKTEELTTPPELNEEIFELPYILGIDEHEPLGLSEYYYLNRDVLPDDIYGFNYNLVPEGHRAIVPISLAREKPLMP